MAFPLLAFLGGAAVGAVGAWLYREHLDRQPQDRVKEGVIRVTDLTSQGAEFDAPPARPDAVSVKNPPA
jgi:hypothetical protein